MRAQAQYTIHTLNDVVTSKTAPASPYLGQLWVDTSKSPPVTKVWNGSAWKEQNGTDTLRSSISTVETKASKLETNLNGLTSTVSSLTKTVETIESDTEEAKENILDLQSSVSTLEQTASSIALRVTQNETNISSLTVTAQGLTTRVSSAEGKITTLTTSVNGLSTRVTNAEGDITSLEQSVSSITTRVTNAEGDITSLEQTATSLTTRVTSSEGKITTLTADISGLKTRVSSAEGAISTLEQTADELTATVISKADSYGGDSDSFGWSLTSDGFYLYSNGQAVMSVTEDGLSVSGSIYAQYGELYEMTITGRLYFGNNEDYFIDPNYGDGSYYIWLPGFRVDDASGAVFSGKLSAPSGTIGGFTITSSAIYKTKTSYSSSTAGVYIGTDGIGLGAGTFYVTSAGALTAKSGTIGGFTISTSAIYKTKSSYSSTTAGVYIGTDGIGLGAGTFYVTSAGALTATSGTIGGFTIGTTSIYKTKTAYSNSTAGVYIGTDGIGLGAGKFYVTSAGAMTATSATVTGTINATSGTFTNVEIRGSIYFNEDRSYFLNPNYNNGSWYIYLPKFRVDDTSAYFSGTLQAPGGTIGGFTISTSSIYKSKTAYSNTTAGVYIGTDGIGLGAGTFYVTSAGYLYATSGKIGGMSLAASQMYSNNFILGTVYDANDSTKSFTTLSFGETSGSTFTATTVLTNSGCYMQALSSNAIACGVIRVQSIRADASISSNTGFYFGYSGGSTQYYAELSWSGQIIYLKIYNSAGVQTALTSAKTFTVHYACIWGGDTTWNATVAKGSSSTSVDTNAFWGIDYATFNYSSSNKAQHTYYFTVSGTSAATTITSYGSIVPWSNNTYDLGSAAYKWRNIYGQAGVVNTSDRNEKFDILPLAEVYDRIFDKLAPVTFKYVENTSNRTHIGLVAQDVKDAVLEAGLTTTEFAGYCEWENEDKTIGCGLRYSEFVAMNIYEIQQLKARIKELEEKIKLTEENNHVT